MALQNILCVQKNSWSDIRGLVECIVTLLNPITIMIKYTDANLFLYIILAGAVCTGVSGVARVTVE